MCMCVRAYVAKGTHSEDNVNTFFLLRKCAPYVWVFIDIQILLSAMLKSHVLNLHFCLIF